MSPGFLYSERGIEYEIQARSASQVFIESSEKPSFLNSLIPFFTRSNLSGSNPRVNQITFSFCSQYISFSVCIFLFKTLPTGDRLQVSQLLVNSLSSIPILSLHIYTFLASLCYISGQPSGETA